MEGGEQGAIDQVGAFNLCAVQESPVLVKKSNIPKT